MVADSRGQGDSRAARRLNKPRPVRVAAEVGIPAAVAGPDALNPRPTRAFLEYSQARGVLLDPARVRHPKDKPHVESGVRYARERWWKGGHLADLTDAREQAERW